MTKNERLDKLSKAFDILIDAFELKYGPVGEYTLSSKYGEYSCAFSHVPDVYLDRVLKIYTMIEAEDESLICDKFYMIISNLSLEFEIQYSGSEENYQTRSMSFDDFFVRMSPEIKDKLLYNFDIFTCL